MSPLPENLVLKVVSEIHDPVTTTDELIPSGETSSYRSNPLGLAEFTLSRKDPEYVGRAKEVQKAQKAVEADTCPGDARRFIRRFIRLWIPSVPRSPDIDKDTVQTLVLESTGFLQRSVKPVKDGSAREQAACFLPEGHCRGNPVSSGDSGTFDCGNCSFGGIKCYRAGGSTAW